MKLIDKQRCIGKQYKTFNIKAEDFDPVSRKISGYGAVFNNIDKAQDMLIRGCFAKSINDRGPESQANDKIIMLWMHDMKEPVGKITKLVEDEKGLYFEAIIDDIPLGDRVIKQLESGTLNQFSIGYNYVWENCQWDNERDCLMVKEVILYELSVVSIGCNGLTEYTGLKSDEVETAINSLQKEIDLELQGLNITKKSVLQELFRKCFSLASQKPIDEQKQSLKEQAEPKHKSIVNGIVFINKKD